jgi:molybdate transport system permease protein
LLSETEITALLLSLQVAGFATFFGLPLAIAAANLLENRDFRGKAIVDGLVHAPLVLPPVIVGYLLLLGFGPQAPIGRFLSDTLGLSFAFNWKGAALAAGIMAFPLMVRAIRLSMAAQDKRLLSVARSLGAGPIRGFFTITLPLAAPGLITGSLLGFARALGEFGATISFVSNIPALTQTLPLALYRAIETPGQQDTAFRLMMISLAIAVAALAASEWLARRSELRLEGGR